jgi:xeroderma pigmentosum group C-complementing protein
VVRKEELEKPIKEITGKFKKNDGSATAVYALWQTDPLLVTADKELPKNDYGNYEVFAHPPPKGTVLFRKSGIKMLLQKNNVRFVEAVDGFDMKSSKMFASKCGYLIYKEDEERITKLYDEYKESQL